ncbi:MDR family MFS transporter [Plantactinospora siamensis]|uniref:MDR family MFS transporter n=1 Tax=Plantactinospora siamensis TaxID=555372 RepID=A0ABV6P536_9ACTN
MTATMTESLERRPVPGTDPLADADGRRGSPYAVLRWLTLATFVVILNETLMVNAIPRLMAQFAVTAGAAQWLSTAFMLTMAVVIPVTGWFLQRATTRQAFTVAMVAFCGGTLLAAAAPAFWVLVVARIVQAAGTAVMLPLLMTTVMTVVPERDRGRVMGNVTLAISVAPALGPTVAGLVLQVTGWRWLFLVVLPTAALVTIAALRRLDNVGQPRPGSVDVLSVVLAAVGFGALVWGLNGLGASSDAPVPPWASVVAGMAAVGLFAVRQQRLQRRPRGPLLDLRALTHRTFRMALGLQAVAFLTMMGAMILLPLYLQGLRGLTPLQTGLLVAPGGLAMGLAGPRIGRAYDRWGARPLIIPGSVAVAAGLIGLGLLGRSTPLAGLVGWHLLIMCGLAMVMPPAFTLSLGSLPARLYAHGSSLLGTVQQVAAAVGTALSVAVLTARSTALVAAGADPAAAAVSGFRWAFAVAAVLALGTVGIALRLPGRPTPPQENAAAERADLEPSTTAFE